MGRELRRKEAKKNKTKKVESEQISETSYSGLTLLKIVAAIAIILFILYYVIAVFITKEVDVSGKKDDTATSESSSSSNNVSNAILAQRTFDQAEEEYYVYYYDFSDEDKNISSAMTNKTDMTIYRVDTSSGLNQKYVTTENGNKSATGINDLKVKNPTLVKVSGDHIALYLEGTSDIVNFLNQ